VRASRETLQKVHDRQRLGTDPVEEQSVDAALADRERRAGGEHHANDERNALAVAPLDAEEPGEPHLGILAVVAPPRCKPQPKSQGPTGAAAQTWSVPGAQELSATHPIQHDRLGDAQVFTSPAGRPPGITPRR
jgi:hypothetical protein